MAVGLDTSNVVFSICINGHDTFSIRRDQSLWKPCNVSLDSQLLRKFLSSLPLFHS